MNAGPHCAATPKRRRKKKRHGKSVPLLNQNAMRLLSRFKRELGVLASLLLLPLKCCSGGVVRQA